jgi:hypothetical protein
LFSKLAIHAAKYVSQSNSTQPPQLQLQMRLTGEITRSLNGS